MRSRGQGAKSCGAGCRRVDRRLRVALDGSLQGGGSIMVDPYEDNAAGPSWGLISISPMLHPEQLHALGNPASAAMNMLCAVLAQHMPRLLSSSGISP